MSILLKEINENIKLICKQIDFQKKRYYYIKKIDDNVLATLHFGYVRFAKKDHIYVDVTVGVSYKDIESLYIRLLEVEKNIFRSTIGTQIGYLMPENRYKEWDFVENSDNTHQYEDILKNIKEYGFPYQKRMSDFNNLLQAFEKREPGILNIARDKYLPIMYYLKGEKQKGVEFIKKAIERQQQPVSEEEKKLLKELAGPGGQVIIGSGIGKVDPAYLKFAENYKKL